METLFETYVLNGGPLMVVLLLCSLILVAVVIRDLIRFRPDRVLPARLTSQAGAWNAKADTRELLDSLKPERSPLGRVLAHALERREERLRMGEAPPPLSELVEDAAGQVADDLYEDLGPLSTIYTVAPLLGLLGTILGMMSAFREYSQATDRDLSALSQGIQQALVTTLWGLSISILAYIAARYFEGRIRRFEREILPPRVHDLLEGVVGPVAESGARPAGGSASPAASESKPAAQGADQKTASASGSTDGAATAKSDSGSGTPKEKSGSGKTSSSETKDSPPETATSAGKKGSDAS